MEIGIAVINSLVSKIIYEGFAIAVKKRKLNIDKKKFENYIFNNIAKKYNKLIDEEVFFYVLNYPEIKDLYQKYLEFNFEFKFYSLEIDEKKDILQLENELLKKLSILVSDKLNNKIGNKFSYELIMSFFKHIVRLCYKYICNCHENVGYREYISNYEQKIIYQNFSNKLEYISKILDEYNNILKENIGFINKDYEKIKEKYTQILRSNNSKQQVYLLDNLEINDFYIPPKIANTDYEYLQENHWTNMFSEESFVYLIGGAGYGKSLFLKMLISNFDKLNIVDASQHLIIYSELKKIINKDGSVKSILDFLCEAVKQSTLMDDSEVGKDFIQYYLNKGRCIICFDALDEVDKEYRDSINMMITSYFCNVNSNNKILITCRDQCFVPIEKKSAIALLPLTVEDISKYLDKMIKLKHFNELDKKIFLEQSETLIKKGFLKSYLILSLLVNIFKGERELPENKIDLYQKCFQYIANKREREKHLENYKWDTFSSIVKESTFAVLAKLCSPNNKYINREVIIEELAVVYEKKYGSRVQSENAVIKFLSFCENRTELFIATSEDNFHFFHRSFFDYFYALYILNEARSVEEIFDKMRDFDFDSEIFELLLARNKQINESLYQKMIDHCLNMLKQSFEANKNEDIIFYFNIFTNWIQIIEDVTYQQEFLDILCTNALKIKELDDKLTNTIFIVNFINKNKQYLSHFLEAYSQISLQILSEIYPFFISRFSIYLADATSTRITTIRRHFPALVPFYVCIYANYYKEKDIIENIKLLFVPKTKFKKQLEDLSMFEKLLVKDNKRGRIIDFKCKSGIKNQPNIMDFI